MALVRRAHRRLLALFLSRKLLGVAFLRARFLFLRRKNRIPRPRKSIFFLTTAAVACVGLLLTASCGGSDASVTPGTPQPPTTLSEPGPLETPETTTEQSLELLLDTNRDDIVVIGVATAGPRDDGGYYQALVETVEEFSSRPGFAPPIIVEEVEPANAATELSNLAEQGVDVIAVGASELAEPLPDLLEQYPDVFWYCNCGSGYPELPGLAQAQDDSSQISFSAGYATGILLRDSGGDSVHFLGCCDLNFEKEAYTAFEMGLKVIDESFTMTYVPTGRHPFDFDNITGAAEALTNAVSQGANAVYPFLGGGHEPVVRLANENEVITMSAGASDACERRDLDYQIAVQYDAGDYVETLLEKIADGDFGEGETFIFSVGQYPFVGAKFCNPTPAQQTELTSMLQRIAADEFSFPFQCIKSMAYEYPVEGCEDGKPVS